jgi:hypothetical protein
MSQPTAAAASPSEKPRTLWERIITSTPIILTVVATVLAGMSAGEMTRAQYYRSLAAQQQAKVSDQWNFFQAKRIRGADMEGTITLLRSGTGAGGVSADSLRAAARRLADDFKRAGQEAEALLKAVEAAKDGLGPEAAERLRQAGQRLRDTAANAAGVAGQFDESLSGTDAGRALAFLSTETVPERVERTAEQQQQLDEALKSIDPPVRRSLNYVDPDLLKSLNDINTEIPRGLAQINARKTERQMAGTLARISEEQIQQAIDDAEDKAADFEEVGKPLAKVYRGLDKLIAQQVTLARELSRAAQEVGAAATAVPAGDAKGLSEVRQATAAATRGESAVRTAAEELANDFKAAQLGFDTRRYEREARYNQTTAGLYELTVRKAGLESERRRVRSQNLFYCMLAAQAGVTVATFALAVRYRSVLWALATVAGAAALSAAAFVFLRM